MKAADRADRNEPGRQDGPDANCPEANQSSQFGKAQATTTGTREDLRTILWLQGAAGNRAVSRMIARRAKPPPPVSKYPDLTIAGALRGELEDAETGHPRVQRECGPGCTDCAACTDGLTDHSATVVQRAGGPFVAHGPVHRAATDGTTHVQRDNEEGTPELVRQLEAEIETISHDADQDRDLYLRAHANRVRLLLRHRSHPRFETQAQLDEFIAGAHRLATTEIDTLTALSSGGAELALATTPKGFPLTWSGRVHAALTLGVDPAALMAEALQRFTALSAEADQLPRRLGNTGLPVRFGEVAALREFRLRMAHQQRPESDPVGSFSRATGRYAQFRFFANFAVTWELIANQVAGAVADGSYVPRFHDYTDFMQNRRRILQELPARARDRLAMSEEELLAIQRDSVGLADATLVAGMTGGLTSFLGILSAWSQGSALFDTALRATDGMVADAGDGERIAMALRWLWHREYLSGAFGAAVDALIASGPDLLKTLAVIVILQMIPGVNVAVDLVLLAELGVDVLRQLTELGQALSEVTSAASVVQLQRAAGRLASVLAVGGLQILTALVTMGIARGVSGLRARAERIRAANPAITEEQAMRQALREATPAERAPLEATLTPWERSVNEETRELLASNPGLRRFYREMNPRVRSLLTRCASGCIPPGATATEVSRIEQLLVRTRNLTATDELLLREHFYAGRAHLGDAISVVERAANVAHLRRLLRDASAGRSSLPRMPTLDPPGHGLPGRWGDPRSPSYGHSYREHGAHLDPNDFRNRAMSERAAGRRVPDSQFYDNALIAEAEQRCTSLTAGEHIVDMGRPVGRVYLPDGTVVSDVTRVVVVRKPDGTVKTSYPIR